MKLKITQLAGADIQIIGSVNAHCKLSGVSEIKISPDLLSEIVKASVRDKYYGDLLKEMMECPEFMEVMKEIQEV